VLCASAGSRERTKSTQNLEMREIYLDSEQRWLKLAASYEALLISLETSPRSNIRFVSPAASRCG
jgi:hypothetical protein